MPAQENENKDFHQKISKLKSSISQIIYLAAIDPIDLTQAFRAFHSGVSKNNLAELFPKLHGAIPAIAEDLFFNITDEGEYFGYLVQTVTPTIDSSGDENWCCMVSVWSYGDTIASALQNSLDSARTSFRNEHLTPYVANIA